VVEGVEGVEGVEVSRLLRLLRLQTRHGHSRDACRASELKPETSAVGSSFRRLPLDGAGRLKPCFYAHMEQCISYTHFLVSNRAIIKVTLPLTIV